jgi:hypothetical protein
MTFPSLAFQEAARRGQADVEQWHRAKGFSFATEKYYFSSGRPLIDDLFYDRHRAFKRVDKGEVLGYTGFVIFLTKYGH